MSTDTHNRNSLYTGYKGVIFGKASAAVAFDHGTGLFFMTPGQTLVNVFKNESDAERGGNQNCVACTFKFDNGLKTSDRASLDSHKEFLNLRAELIQNIFEENGIKTLQANAHIFNFEVMGVGQELSDHEFHMIEFKFLKEDADAVRETILLIDEEAGGTLCKRAYAYHASAPKMAA